MRNSSSLVSKQGNHIGTRTYSDGGHRHARGEDKDDADEKRPSAGPGVDKDAKLSQVPWTGHELAKDNFTAGPLLGTKSKTRRYTYKIGMQ
jgi:hypothetical protein